MAVSRLFPYPKTTPGGAAPPQTPLLFPGGASPPRPPDKKKEQKERNRQNKNKT